MVNVDFKQLAIFKRLAEEKHFARTADAFHLTASAVTRSIQRLEEEMGCCLLLRKGRVIELTSAGEALLNFADEALHQLEILQNQLHAQQTTLTGKLKIFCSVTASYCILPDLFAYFRLRHPDVEILLHTGDQADGVERVQSAQEDIAVSVKPLHLPPSMAFKTLHYTPLRFIVQKAGDVNRRVKQQLEEMPIIDPANLPLIIAEKGVVRAHFDDWVKRQQATPSIYAQVTGHEAIVSMVALGCGVGLVPEVVIDNSPLKDKISVINEAPEFPVIEVGLCVLQEKLQVPQVRRFWQAAGEYFYPKKGQL